MNRRTYLASSLAAVTAAALAKPVLAQNATQASTGSLNAVDPASRASMTVLPPYKVLDDSRVTFQFTAPQATAVVVKGEWPGGLVGSSTLPLSKDANGLWTGTTDPLPSDLWSYSFLADGVTVAPTFGNFGDPTPGLPASNFVVPGAYGNDFAPQGHPNGVLAYPYVPFMGTFKHLTVYTPPGYYDNDETRYPVLYLTMGGKHTGTEGLEDAYLFNLLENFIAAGKAKPMILVVLDPEAPGGNSIGYSSFSGGGNQTTQAYVDAAQAIADEIVPWIDKAYRTVAERQGRAIGGFSSPGAQGFLAGGRNPEKFATIFAFSGGFPTWPDVGVQIQSPLDPKLYSGPDLNRVPDMEKLGAMIPKLTASAQMKLVLYMSARVSRSFRRTD